MIITTFDLESVLCVIPTGTKYIKPQRLGVKYWIPNPALIREGRVISSTGSIINDFFQRV